MGEKTINKKDALLALKKAEHFILIIPDKVNTKTIASCTYQEATQAIFSAIGAIQNQIILQEKEQEKLGGGAE